MSLFIQGLLETLSFFEDQIDMFKVQLQESPTGRLIYQKDVDGRDQFIKLVKEDGKRRRFGLNRNENEIRALARKEFATKALEILEYNTDVLREAISKQQSFDPNEILKSMTKAYALLPEDYFFDRNQLVIAAGLDGEAVARIQRHEDWWRKPYKEYWGYPEKKTKTSSRGQKVRSKSELLIVETLYKYGIHFHYEQEFEVKGKTFAPDITFEGAGHRLYYWEHLGMMDNSYYARRNLKKLEDYYDIGMVPGDNLILSFDNKDDINMQMIDAIIQNEVIPRL